MGEISFIFHELRSPENLGSIARAMNNFGLSRLILAKPLTYAFGEAEKLAVKSAGLLDAMRVEPTLQGALASHSYVVGTTSRQVRGRACLDGAQAAVQLVGESHRGDVALLFGSEKLGLNDEALDLCQAVCRLPTCDPQPSLNVAQAAAILAYEVRRAQGASTKNREGPPLAPRANRALMERLYAQMQFVLLEAGFLNPQNPGDILDELRRVIDRAAPEPREAELLLAAFKKLGTRARARSGAAGKSGG